MLSACSGDDAPSASTTPPSTTTAGPAPTATPPVCEDLEDEYLDTFFALGAGTPNDPAATTVRLPVRALEGIEARARRQGCADFTDVVCSAYAELDAQGLAPTNTDPPAGC